MERLSVCLSVLFLTMIANAMWYQKSDDNGESTGLVIGPISISGKEITTSIASSIIVVPPILAITQLFLLSKRESDYENCKRSDIKSENHSKKYKVNQKKVGRPLPHWCVYIAWVIVFLSIAASAFFTILYALSWGGAKSTAWLVAFVLSFIESVILIQPIKVKFLAKFIK